jgi:cytochrome c biogenesis protein
MMGGLLVSLVIRRRRIWVRITPADPGSVSVELGGLARTDNSGWGDEFERLTERLLAGAEDAQREERDMNKRNAADRA